jgi:ParB-like nuclease domain
MEDNDDGGNSGASSAAGLVTWARAHAQGTPKDRTAVRATALEDGPFEGTAKHPFQVADRTVYLAAVRGKGIASRTHNAPMGTIQLDQLHGIQKTVNRERLGQHMSNPRLIPNGARGAGHGGLIDLPVVVKVNGTYHVHDGHHRLVAAHLRGEQVARCRLIDLDEGQTHEP